MKDKVESQLAEPIIDLKALLLSIWKNKFLFFLLFLCSIPVSIFVISSSTPMYRAETVVNNKVNSSSSSSVVTSPFQMEFGFSSLFNGQSGDGGDFLPKLLGTDFLRTVIYADPNIEKNLKEYCSYSPPGPLSLTHLFDKFGVMKKNVPNAVQKEEVIINCMKKLIEVKPFANEAVKTNAFSVSVESEDPFFSAGLANKLIEKFFASEIESKKKTFKKELRFLSDSVATADIEFRAARQELDDYILKNIEVFGFFDSRQGDISFSSKLKQKIEIGLFNVAELEEMDLNIDGVIRGLEINAKKSPKEVLETLEAMGIPSELSSEFLFDLRKLVGKNLLTSDLSSLISNEIENLLVLKRENRKKITDNKNDLQDMLEAEKQYYELEAKLEKQLKYLNALEDQLVVKTLDADKNDLDEFRVYSTAIAPLYPFSPNKKFILVMSAIIFLIIGFIITIVVQSFRKTIFTINQIQTFESEKLFELSRKKDLNLYNYEFGFGMKSVPFSLGFISLINNLGKTACIIDISKNDKNEISDADKLSITLGSVLAERGVKTVVKTENYNRPVVVRSDKSSSTQLKLDEGSKTENFLKVETTNFLSDKGTLDGDKEFQKVLIALGSKVSDVEKFSLIDSVDFFILLGRTGRFSLDRVLKFTSQTPLMEKKCVGLFLIT